MEVDQDLVMALEYAPALYLHPDEDYFPMDPKTFAGESRLCLVRDKKVVSVLNAVGGTWDSNPDARHYGIPIEVLEKWPLLHGPEDGSWTRRPHDKKGPPPPDRELFALEHVAKRPIAQFDRTDPPPCFFYMQEWKDSTLISYWFFYGYSEFISSIAHQGDWEHTTLRIRDDAVVGGFFAVHEDVHYVKGPDLQRTDDGRIRVYSAKNRHGTWWKEGQHFVGLTAFQDKETLDELRGVDRSLLRDETKRGPLWDLRLKLEPLDTQPWVRFAGAWGAVGSAGHATGPLGPWFKRDIQRCKEVVIE